MLAGTDGSVAHDQDRSDSRVAPAAVGDFAGRLSDAMRYAEVTSDRDRLQLVPISGARLSGIRRCGVPTRALPELEWQCPGPG